MVKQDIRRNCSFNGTPMASFGKWIPVKYHFLTEEEIRKNKYPECWDTMLDCEMPENEERILITYGNDVLRGYAIIDDLEEEVLGRYCFCTENLESGECINWEDIEAWMPLPKPYSTNSRIRSQRESKHSRSEAYLRYVSTILENGRKKSI